MSLKVKRFENGFEDKMEPGAFIGGVFIASGVKDSVIIYHGYLGCNIEAIHMRSDTVPGGYYTPIIATGLDENDSIYGGNEKLFNTLEIIASKNFKFIWILTGDATSIIADDIYSHVTYFESKYKIRIIPIDIPGFIGGIAKGTDITTTKFLEKVGVSDQKLQGLDLFFPHLMGIKSHNLDVLEIKNLLSSSGIQVNNVFSRNIDLKIGESIYLSDKFISLTSEKIDLTENYLINKSINIIDEPLPLPMGIANTEKWLFYVASKFNMQEKAKEVLIKEKEILLKQLKYNYNYSWLSSLYNEKTCSIYGNSLFSASLALCLYYDFNIIPKVVAIISESPESIEIGLELLNQIADFVDIKILINPDYHSYAMEIRKYTVDFSIGSIQDKSLCVGNSFPHMNLGGYYFFNNFNFIPWPYLGIKGTLSILTELGFLMEKIFYNEESWKKFSFEQ